MSHLSIPSTRSISLLPIKSNQETSVKPSLQQPKEVQIIVENLKITLKNPENDSKLIFQGVAQILQQQGWNEIWSNPENLTFADNLNESMTVTLKPEMEIPSLLLNLKTRNQVKKSLFLLQKKNDVAKIIAEKGMETLEEIILQSDGNTLSYALFVLDLVLKSIPVQLSQQTMTFLLNVSFTKDQMSNIVRPSLTVLSKSIKITPSWISTVANERIIGNLANKLTSPDQGIQESSLNLINTIVSLQPSRQVFGQLESFNVPGIISKLELRQGLSEDFEKDLLEFQTFWSRNLLNKSKMIQETAGMEAMKKDLTMISSIPIPSTISELALENLHTFVLSNSNHFDETLMNCSIDFTSRLVNHWKIEQESRHFEPLLFHFHQIHGILMESFNRLTLISPNFTNVYKMALIKTQFRYIVNNLRTTDLIMEFKQRMLDLNVKQLEKFYVTTLEMEPELENHPTIKQMTSEIRQRQYEILENCRMSTLKKGDVFLIEKVDFIRQVKVESTTIYWNDIPSNQKNPSLNQKMELKNCKIEWKKGISNCIVIGGDEILELSCTDEKQACEWYDGLNMIVKSGKLHSTTETLLDRLTNVGLHITLLNVTTHGLKLS